MKHPFKTILAVLLTLVLVSGTAFPAGAWVAVQSVSYFYTKEGTFWFDMSATNTWTQPSSLGESVTVYSPDGNYWYTATGLSLYCGISDTSDPLLSVCTLDNDFASPDGGNIWLYRPCNYEWIEWTEYWYGGGEYNPDVPYDLYKVPNSSVYCTYAFPGFNCEECNTHALRLFREEFSAAATFRAESSPNSTVLLSVDNIDSLWKTTLTEQDFMASGNNPYAAGGTTYLSPVDYNPQNGMFYQVYYDGLDFTAGPVMDLDSQILRRTVYLKALRSCTLELTLTCSAIGNSCAVWYMLDTGMGLYPSPVSCQSFGYYRPINTTNLQATDLNFNGIVDPEECTVGTLETQVVYSMSQPSSIVMNVTAMTVYSLTFYCWAEGQDLLCHGASTSVIANCELLVNEVLPAGTQTTYPLTYADNANGVTILGFDDSYFAQYYDGVAGDKSGIGVYYDPQTRTLTLPQTVGGRPVTQIGSGAMYTTGASVGLEDLYVVLPNTVESIDEYAFSPLVSRVHIPFNAEVSPGIFAYRNSGTICCDAPNSAAQQILQTSGNYQFIVCTEHGVSHTHVFDEAVVTEPTCTAGGYTTYTCTQCGTAVTTDETSALGHDFGEWVVTTPATTEAEGVETSTCSRCGETQTRAIAPLQPAAYSGYCGLVGSFGEDGNPSDGTNLAWTFDPATGVMTISGFGLMADYDLDGYSGNGIVLPPWYAHKDLIRKIVLESGVFCVGNDAFRDCTAVEQIDMPDGFSGFGSGAICGCTNLKTIELPDSVTDIFDFAFAGSCLESITLPAHLTAIEEGAFNGCSQLKSIRLPGTIERIGGFVFSGCSSLESVVIEEGIRGLGTNTFQYCTALTEVVLPDSLTGELAISEDVFAGCTNLKTVHIPSTVTQIGNAFGGCTALESICSDSADCAAAEYAAQNGIAFRVCNGHETYSGYCGYVGEYTDGQVYDGTNLTWTLDADTGLLTISGEGPMGLGTEDSGAWFDYSPLIRKVVIEDGVTSLLQFAFDAQTYGCEDLEEVYIPGTIADENWYYAFANCKKLTTVELGEGLTHIADDAFLDCTALEQIDIPDTVTSIGWLAFYGCTALESITIPDSVTALGEGAFGRCTAATSVSIGKGLTSMYAAPFDNCWSVQAFTVDADNVSFSVDENGVLYDKDKTALCYYPAGSAETAFTMPDSVKFVYGSAFNHCNVLETIVFPDGIASVYVSSCDSLKSVHIPSSAETIALNYCGSIESICSDSADCAAAEYAAQNGIAFRVCNGHGETPRIAGDASGDGVLDLRDVTVLMRYLAGGWGETVDASAADVDGDGKLTLKDVALLRRYLAGWDVELI